MILFSLIRDKQEVYFEEIERRAGADGSVLYLRLTGQIFGRVDGGHHSFNCQKGGQVGRVRRDENEREEPPDGANHSARY